MAALLRAWELPAIRCQLPLGQLGRRLLHHRAPGRHVVSGVTPRVPRDTPAALTQPSRGVVAAAVGTKASEEVNKGIVKWYDDSLTAWQKFFGDHVHQGFYDPGATPSPAGNRQAIIRTIDETLRFADITDDPAKRPKKILDVGCGMGAGTVYLAKRFAGVQCDGINICPVQIERGRALAAAEGLEDRVTFHLADAMEQPFPDGQFDLVWSMESAEHMPDKKKFFSELARVAAPGAKIVVATVCHRDLEVEPLKPDEEILLERIRDVYQHASSYSPSGYVKIAQSLSLQDIKTADWTENIVPFWLGVMQAGMTLEGSAMALESGLTIMKSIFMLPTLIEACKTKLVNYSVITCRKPW